MKSKDKPPSHGEKWTNNGISYEIEIDRDRLKSIGCSIVWLIGTEPASCVRVKKQVISSVADAQTVLEGAIVESVYAITRLRPDYAAAITNKRLLLLLKDRDAKREKMLIEQADRERERQLIAEQVATRERQRVERRAKNKEWTDAALARAHEKAKCDPPETYFDAHFTEADWMKVASDVVSERRGSPHEMKWFAGWLSTHRIEELTSRDLLVMRLKYKRGLSITEIAARLKSSHPGGCGCLSQAQAAGAVRRVKHILSKCFYNTAWAFRALDPGEGACL